MDEHGYDYAARVRVATLKCRPQTGASISEPNPVEVAEEEERHRGLYTVRVYVSWACVKLRVPCFLVSAHIPKIESDSLF